MTKNILFTTVLFSINNYSYLKNFIKEHKLQVLLKVHKKCSTQYKEQMRLLLHILEQGGILFGFG